MRIVIILGIGLVLGLVIPDYAIAQSDRNDTALVGSAINAVLAEHFPDRTGQVVMAEDPRGEVTESGRIESKQVATALGTELVNAADVVSCETLTKCRLATNKVYVSFQTMDLEVNTGTVYVQVMYNVGEARVAMRGFVVKARRADGMWIVVSQELAEIS